MGSCFFWTLQKSTAATAAAYINTVMCFLLRFCVFPLIDATRMHLTNISFFPFKYLYAARSLEFFLFSFLSFFFFALTLLHVPLFEIHIIYTLVYTCKLIKINVYNQSSDIVSTTKVSKKSVGFSDQCNRKKCHYIQFI